MIIWEFRGLPLLSRGLIMARWTGCPCCLCIDANISLVGTSSRLIGSEGQTNEVSKTRKVGKVSPKEIFQP